MTLDKLLKENAAWLDQAAKQRVFDRIDERTLALPEAQRQQRIADLKARIDTLAQRKADAAASYDRVIALEKAELDSLMAEKPPQAPARAMKPMAARKKIKKKK
jgi:hypothetical protein